MLKKIIFSVTVIFSFCASAPCAYSQTKKDVSDPVLQEILAFFHTRMPRFINLHGEDIFVTDDPVTRGGFISALYEYDKSLKFASKQEFADIKNRIWQMEKNQSQCLQRTEPNNILAAIQPGMPQLLDKTLNFSKVMLEVKSEIAKVPGGAEQQNVNKAVNDNLNDLKGRVGKIEAALAVQSAVPAKSEAKAAELEKRMSLMNIPQQKENPETLKRIDKLNESVAKMLTAQPPFMKLEERVALLEKSPKPAASQKTDDLAKKVNDLEISITRIKESIQKTEELERKIKNENKSGSSPVLSENVANDIIKRLEKLEISTAGTKELENRIERLEKASSNQHAGAAVTSSTTQENTELKERIRRLETIVQNYAGLEKEISKLEQKINSVERVSSLGNLSSSEEISDLTKRIDALEKTLNK